MEDIGKNTVFILLILTILISVVGTWIIMANLDPSRERQPDRIIYDGPTDSDTANLRLTIIDKPKQGVDQATLSLVIAK